MVKKLRNIILSAIVIVIILPSQLLWAKLDVHTLIKNQVYYGELPKPDEVKQLSEKYFITYVVHLTEPSTSSIADVLASNQITDLNMNINKDINEDNLAENLNYMVIWAKQIGKLRAEGEVIYIIEPRNKVELKDRLKCLEEVIYLRHRACYRIDNNAKEVQEGKLIEEVKEIFPALAYRKYKSWLDSTTAIAKKTNKEILCDSQPEFLAEEGYIHEDHAGSFFSVSEKYEVAIGIRNAGHYTLKWIANGNPRKGHGILEKSIKPKSLAKLIEDTKENKIPDGDKKLKYLFDKKLFGLVGGWGGTIIPYKVYTAKIKSKDMERFYTEHDPGEKQKLFEIVNFDYEHPSNPLENLNLAYTGDYDLQELIRMKHVSSSSDGTHGFRIYRLQNHEDSETDKIFEMVNKGNGEKITPAEPLQNDPLLSDAFILRQLNKSLAQWGISDPSKNYRTGPDCPIQHWSLIQHGAQQNYMWSYKRQTLHEDLLATLLNPDADIAIVLPNSAGLINPSMNKNMLIFRDASEINLFYKMIKLMPWWELELNRKTFNGNGIKAYAGKAFKGPGIDDTANRKKLEDTREKYTYEKEDQKIVNKAKEDAQISSHEQQLAEPYKYK